MSFWYHFAIMFEALFILTTIDAGTRVARFLVQEFGGKVWKPFERTDWIPGEHHLDGPRGLRVGATSSGPGTSARSGRCSGPPTSCWQPSRLPSRTSAIINAGKERYAWVTLVPMLFVAATTLTACWLNITDNFWPLTAQPETAVQGYVNSLLTLVIMICAVVVLIEAARSWYRVLVKGEYRDRTGEVGIAIGRQEFYAADVRLLLGEQ